MSSLTPREIADELNKFIIGQTDAKRAVAVALRNRWRRKQLSPELQKEIYPKNILMIGPTGVGKTEISRRLAHLANAPFVKVEATKFTEIGYVGRDVEQIIRDLVETAIVEEREKIRTEFASKAQEAAERRVLQALAGEGARPQTLEMFRTKLHNGDLDDHEIEIEVTQRPKSMQMFEIPGQPGANMGMLDLQDMLGKAFGRQTTHQRMTVAESYAILMEEEIDQLINDDKIAHIALKTVEENGIVFLDEIDKLCARSNKAGHSGEISREGVQRDLLPLIEGTTVSTKYGSLKTDHILFIASGAFHIAKPSDLLPELQGRLPIRVELRPLTQEDFIQILTTTKNALTHQYSALLETENITITFTEDGVVALARISAEINQTVENIGARRLYTVMERVFEEINFSAPERKGDHLKVDKKFVEENLGTLAHAENLQRYIL